MPGINSQQCPKCSGSGSLAASGDDVDGSPDQDFSCPDCNGTGKQGNAELIAELEAKLNVIADLSTGWKYGEEGVHLLRIHDISIGGFGAAISRAEGKRV